MGILDESQFSERVEFFNGQRLFDSDLNGLDAFNREMRWLHNKSLHQPGIGNGFAVSGNKGDREVTIEPGYGIDSMGREIVLTTTQTLPIPPVAGDLSGKPAIFLLTVSYATDLEETETREGICLPRGVVRRREAPVFCWIQLRGDDPGNLHADPESEKAIKAGIKIIISQIEIADCRLNKPVSVAQRRNARPSVQPYITCGVSDLSEWTWTRPQRQQVATIFKSTLQPLLALMPKPATLERLLVSRSAVSNVYGLRGGVDTSSAGFLTTPHYSFAIQGQTLSKERENSIYAIDLLHRIERAEPTGFEAFILILLVGGRGEEGSRRTIRTDPRAKWVQTYWKLTWMGVEG